MEATDRVPEEVELTPRASRAIRVLVVFTSNPRRAISSAIRAIAASALPGRQQMTKSSA